jgi:hypothetical protein
MKPWQTSLNKTPNKRGREGTKRESEKGPKSKARRRAKAQRGSLIETKEQIMFPSPPLRVARSILERKKRMRTWYKFMIILDNQNL